MARASTSFRIDSDLRERLESAAAREGLTLTALVERLTREGLATAQHPGIFFRAGPSGRRAALAAGPDVWEVIAAARRLSGGEAKRVAALAKEFGIHERQVLIALDYAAAHRDEVDAQVDANDVALAEAERIAKERRRLLS